ncbi:hypothetical protein FB459_1640 [Yimella lutea]|uniref:Uncharacterized protein n=1 Tax=Yimella lutea TaxID=587872 RepID=A0A542EFT2_9MICO|nr:hypothetical protein [Yimella lutea]TQJ14193.1 hypothetical protein FB459_1640 [Yimella lutea]
MADLGHRASRATASNERLSYKISRLLCVVAFISAVLVGGFGVMQFALGQPVSDLLTLAGSLLVGCLFLSFVAVVHRAIAEHIEEDRS